MTFSTILAQFCCRGGVFFPLHTPNTTTAAAAGSSASAAVGAAAGDSIIAFNKHYHLACDMPQYVFLTALLAYLVVAVFLRTAALLKLLLLAVMAVGYIVVLLYTHPRLFSDLDDRLK